MPANSVLSFIVPKLVIQTENAISECLYFILYSSPNAAAAFLETLAPAGVSFPRPLVFSTQAVWPDVAIRPDMIARLEKGPTYLVVEAKFHAPLTENQPTEYIQCLPNDEPGLLLFIAPRERSDRLWDELARRCASKRRRLGDRLQHASGLVSARLVERHVLALISWESLIDGLVTKLQGDPAANRAVLADLAQVDDLSKRVISGELSRIVFDEQARNEREDRFRRIVDRIVKDLVDARCATTKGYRATPGPGYYKRFMTLSGKVNWCVEFNAEYWARFGESPLWLSVNSDRDGYREYCAVLKAQLANSQFQFEDRLLIPLRARNAGTPDEAEAQMSRQALSVAGLIANISVDESPAEPS